MASVDWPGRRILINMSDGVHWGSGEFQGQVWDGGRWRYPTEVEKQSQPTSGPGGDPATTSWEAAMLSQAQRTARDVATIKTIMVVLFVLMVLGAIIMGVATLSAMNTSPY